METTATFHRKLREKEIDVSYFHMIHPSAVPGRYRSRAHRLASLVVTRGGTGESRFLNLPANVYLRTGDAIHLATASEAGFKEIYSNDRHLFLAASLFKLKGINPLAK